MFTITFPLSNENIDHYVGLVRETGAKKKAERRMLTAACLTLEEVLLNDQARFGAAQKVRLRLKKRSNQLVILAEVPGAVYNPLETDGDAGDGFLLGALDTKPRFTYAGGVNRVTLSLVIDEGRKELTTIALSVLLGVGLGLLGKLLPADAVALCQILVDAVSSAVFGLVKMAAMPVIFLCVVYGILGSGTLNSFKESGLRILGKMLLSVFLMLLFGSAVSMLAFGIRPAAAGTDVSSFSILVDTLFSIVPDNIFAPFMNGDNIKIIMLGVIFGCALLVLGEKADIVSDLCRQLKDVCSLVMVWASKLIPLLIVTVLIDIIWSGELTTEIFGLWMIVAVFLGCAAVILLAAVCKVARARRMPLRQVAKAVLLPGMKGLVSASSIFCYADMEEGLRSKLKVSENAISFGLPIGFAFYQPMAMLFGVFLLYFAGFSGLSVDAGWLVSYLLLTFVTALAVPPVSGSTVSLLAILFASLGETDPRIAMAYPLFMLLDYPYTAFRVMMLMLELAGEKPEEVPQS